MMFISKEKVMRGSCRHGLEARVTGVMVALLMVCAGAWGQSTQPSRTTIEGMRAAQSMSLLRTAYLSRKMAR